MSEGPRRRRQQTADGVNEERILNLDARGSGSKGAKEVETGSLASRQFSYSTEMNHVETSKEPWNPGRGPVRQYTDGSEFRAGRNANPAVPTVYDGYGQQTELRPENRKKTGKGETSEGSEDGMPEHDFGADERLMSPWGYIGYSLLFSIPIAGLVLMIVFSVKTGYKNRQNYSRACLLMILIGVLVVVILSMALGLQINSVITRLSTAR